MTKEHSFVASDYSDRDLYVSSRTQERIAFIIVGLSLILGVSSRSAIGFDNLTRHGGFLPTGWKGVWLSLTITVTSYMGVEIIAVTAGEAQHPEVSIPHAMRNIVWRLILFYVLAIAIMVTMVPWNQTSSSSALSASPFVTAFRCTIERKYQPLPFHSHAFLSRPGRGGYAPEWIGKVSGNGVPHRAAGFNRGDYRSHSAGHLCT